MKRQGLLEINSTKPENVHLDDCLADFRAEFHDTSGDADDSDYLSPNNYVTSQRWPEDF